MKSSSILALVVFAGCCAAACRSRLVAIVDGVLLPECDSAVVPPKAPIVAVRAEPTVPDEQLAFAPGQVQLAIDRDVPWARVETLMAILEEKKTEPILLVGFTYRVRRFTLNDTLTGAPKFTITGDAHGKFCVQTAQLPQAYCVQGSDRKHIHRAFVRETVREVVKKWEMHEVQVFVDPAMSWADVVRIVDGARTCCGDKTKVLVAVAREAPLGADAEAGNPAIRDVEADQESGAEPSPSPAPSAAPPGAPGAPTPAPSAAPTAPAAPGAPAPTPRPAPTAPRSSEPKVSPAPASAP